MTEKKIRELIQEELNKEVCIYVEKMNKDIELPIYSSYGDAGMDIRSSEDITLLPRETKVIHTGLKIAIPLNYEIQVRPRSGLSLKSPLRIANAPGTIDSGYRDELGIIVTNSSLKKNYEIKKGDRIAQIVLCRIARVSFVEKEDVTTIGINRNGGFGHTGIN